MDSDWISDLFIEHGDLFQALLEERFARAEGEAQGLAHLFQVHGISPEATILDLSCGIGRHAIHLAQLGYRVVGADLSPRFIARARELASEHGVRDRTEFLVLDVRQAERLAPRRFDAVINMYTSLGYYDEEADASILRRCRALTRRNGIFVLDTSFREGAVRHFTPSGAVHIGNLLLVEERKLNLETSRMENVWTFFEQTGDGYRFRAEIPFRLRIYGLHELIALFTGAGWRYRAAYRDFELRQASLESARLIVVAENPEHGEERYPVPPHPAVNAPPLHSIS
ncbi:MAG TPA: class I SAM-dependent methyltransferase [Candidatus Acetothermia bacterium]|nr:class I SAM-dependent methyltransferase [Candidatus Acetothermia bacterium]